VVSVFVHGFYTAIVCVAVVARFRPTDAAAATHCNRQQQQIREIARREVGPGLAIMAMDNANA